MNTETKELKAAPMCCEEASHMSHSHYIPCNKPATQIIMADGVETRMCDMCAHHSVKNRNMKKVRDLAPDEMLPPRAHNKPPSPIEVTVSAYEDVILEAQNWADGEPVTTEAQMLAVDKVLKEFKTYKTALSNAAKEQTDPLHKAWKAEVAAVKVYTDDADRLQSALVATVGPFKAKIAAEKAEADRKAQAEAWEATRKAQEAARAVNAADIEAQRAAAAAMAEAEAAQDRAKAAAKDTVKGMRTVTHYAMTDHKAALHWIAANDREAVTAFIEEYVRKNHKTKTIAGVNVWETKEAF